MRLLAGGEPKEGMPECGREYTSSLGKTRSIIFKRTLGLRQLAEMLSEN
jgi:hypothetical protein